MNHQPMQVRYPVRTVVQWEYWLIERTGWLTGWLTGYELSWWGAEMADYELSWWGAELAD